MSLLRNSILCLEREQLPIFKETIDLVLNQYFEVEGIYKLNPKAMVGKDLVEVKHRAKMAEDIASSDS